MYIKKLILENFQSHKYSELDFSKGMNVIVGHSDSGKTSILRAIRWCLYNEPGGIDFLREGERQISVTIHFQNGVILTRLRSPSKNQYILQKPNEEDLILEGFGTLVPFEVEESTRISKTKLDDKRALPLNYAAQLDGPFLLNENDSFKAASIGRLVGVHIIDESMRDTLRDKKQITYDLKKKKEQQKDLEKQLESFDGLDDMIFKRDKVSHYMHQIDEIQKKISQLSIFQGKFSLLKEEMEKARRTIADLNILEELEILLLTMENKSNLEKKVSTIWKKFLENQEKIAKEKEILSYYKDLSSLQSYQSLLQEKLNIYNQGSHFYNRCQKILEEKKEISLSLENFSSIESIDVETLHTLNQKYSLLFHLNQRLKDVKGRIQLGIEYTEQFQNISSLEELLSKMESSRNLWRTQQELYKKYQEIKSHRKNLESAYSDALESYNHLYHSLNDSLLKMGRCPLCNQRIEGDAMEHIIHNLGGEEK
ncbi:AAA family ATPase [Peptoniphilus sp. KCTC 25270]|uniref:AAA family ATPase n=1 Tax=Peptoniphilus sp. KCTC 25270 TaxID=2897414 RepID=UPI001E36C073|nr:AAA family ATPase [Peptoniphilus sp. KCTC 25270]MCD1147003.1 AAA family ATPase [Peptoniphilus sp. KCTC 25270]